MPQEGIDSGLFVLDLHIEGGGETLDRQNTRQMLYATRELLERAELGRREKIVGNPRHEQHIVIREITMSALEGRERCAVARQQRGHRRIDFNARLQGREIEQARQRQSDQQRDHREDPERMCHHPLRADFHLAEFQRAAPIFNGFSRSR